MSDPTLPPIRHLALLGAGKLGEALLEALLAAGCVTTDTVTVTRRRAGRLAELVERHGVSTTTDNRAAVQDADVVLLAVKPQNLTEVVADVATVLAPGALVISVAAGVTIEQIETALGREQPVVRAMPNTAARIRESMTVVSPGAHAGPEHLALATHLFDAVGRTMTLDERYLDAVTGLSASGPAFLYVVLEALAEGGVKVGLPRRVATELVAQAMLGVAKMILQTEAHPALLKDEVTTPAGCTIDGLLQLEEGGLRVTLIKAIDITTRRAHELAGE